MFSQGGHFFILTKFELALLFEKIMHSKEFAHLAFDVAEIYW
jgi:hypothetical protein